jgi:hypothetical protein
MWAFNDLEMTLKGQNPRSNMEIVISSNVIDFTTYVFSNHICHFYDRQGSSTIFGCVCLSVGPFVVLFVSLSMK